MSRRPWIVQTALTIASMGAILFGCAGRFDIPAFWEYLAVNAIISLSVLVLDVELLQERTAPGGQSLDRRYGLLFIPMVAHLCLAGWDVGRCHWSDTVPLAIQLGAVVVLGASYGVMVWAMWVNRFFSSIVRIQRDRGHQLVTAGPYRWVRHPGYASGLMALLASGPALGSWISMVPLLVLIPPLLIRLLNEERVLRRDLPGYEAYAREVPYRLIPGIW